METQSVTRPPRLSRAERKAQTREQLLEAAARVFAHKGYAAASVDDIAAEAGFTVGALYSNFGGKQELLMAAFERHCDQDLARVQALLATDLPLERQLDAITHQLGDLSDEHRQWWLLSMELWLYAQRHPARTGRPLPVPASELAAAMLGLWQGLMLQRLTDPDSMPPQAIGTALAWLRDGAAQHLTGGGRP